MNIEVVLSEVKQLSDEEIAVILDRLDDEKSQLGTECLNYCSMGNREAATECMEEYFRIDKLRDFVRSLCPLQVPKKQIFKNVVSEISTKSSSKTWELYSQGERKV